MSSSACCKMEARDAPDLVLGDSDAWDGVQFLRACFFDELLVTPAGESPAKSECSLFGICVPIEPISLVKSLATRQLPTVLL